MKRNMRSNGRRFQRALERIVERYSKVQHENDAVEVDLDNTRLDALERYMTLSKKKLDKMEYTSDIDLREDSLEDSTKDSLLDYTSEKRSDFSTTNLFECDEMQNDATGYTINPLEEGQRNCTLLSDQPEDQDEELEVSLQSQGSSLGECYPDMVSQLGKSWHRHHVSEAAESVRRRYRKWLKSTQVHRTNSSHVDQRPHKRELFSKQHHTLRSPLKSGPSAVAKSASPSPVKTFNGQRLQYNRSPVRSEARAVVFDMPAFYEEFSRKFNKTFTVSEPSSFLSTFNTSPPKSRYSPNKTIQDFSLKIKDSPHCSSVHGNALFKEGYVSPNKPKQDFSSRITESPCHSSFHSNPILKEIYMSPAKTSPSKAKTSRESFNEGSHINGSPTRKSPFKLHTSREGPQQSAYAHVSSPTSSNMKALKRSSSASNFVSSPSKLAVPRSTLEHPNQRHSFQQWSPQVSKPRRSHHGLKRHLSFDSVAQSSRRTSSDKDFEDDFVKLYHKLVCLSKSSYLKSHPCRFCAKNSDSSRGHSNLAALALSPHRPFLRKRSGDLQSFPASKRFRDVQVPKEF